MSVRSAHRRSPTSRRRGVLIAVAAGLVGVAAAPAAEAASVTTPNACRWSYGTADEYLDMNLAITTAATLAADPRYPEGGESVPGRTLRTEAGTLDVELPQHLARFGAAVGLIEDGRNDITVRSWYAVEASGTAEGRRVERAEFPASIDAHVVDSTLVGDADFVYTPPTIPERAWRTTGGDVQVRQGRPGASTVPRITYPTASGDRTYTPEGSVVLVLTFERSKATFIFDCSPGVVDRAHPTWSDVRMVAKAFLPTTAQPIASFAGPRNQICLNELGRQVTGEAAAFPADQDRELDPTRLGLARTGGAALPAYRRTVPFALDGVRLQGELSGDTVSTLGRYETGGALLSPGTAYPLRGAVTIEATNTVEGRQTVALPAGTTWTPTRTVAGPPSTWAASPVDVALPTTSWTPNGAGPVEFRIAPAGTAPPITLAGQPGGPGGAPEVGTYDLTPHGSTVLQLGTARNPVALDCVQAAVAVTPAVAWSDLGRVDPPAGSRGRYAFVAPADGTATFARSVDSELPPPTADPGPVVDPPVVQPPPLGDAGGIAQPPLAQPPVIVRPPVAGPPATKTTTVRIASSSLRSSKGRVRLSLANLAATPTSGRLTLVTRDRLRVGKARRAARVTLVRGASFRLPRGARRTISVALTKDARTLLRTRRTLRATLTVTPARSGTERVVSRAVTVRR